MGVMDLWQFAERFWSQRGIALVRKNWRCDRNKRLLEQEGYVQ